MRNCLGWNMAKSSVYCTGQASIAGMLVYKIKQRLPGEVAAQVLAQQLVLALPHFFRETRDVGRDKHVLQSPEFRHSRQGLVLENIERSSANTFTAQSVEQSCLHEQQ